MSVVVVVVVVGGGCVYCPTGGGGLSIDGGGGGLSIDGGGGGGTSTGGGGGTSTGGGGTSTGGCSVEGLSTCAVYCWKSFGCLILAISFSLKVLKKTWACFTGTVIVALPSVPKRNLTGKFFFNWSIRRTRPKGNFRWRDTPIYNT